MLVEASNLVSTAKGCKLYLVSTVPSQDAVTVYEIWESKEDHGNSLNVEGVRELITKAMPLMNGKPERTELSLLGGHGIN